MFAKALEKFGEEPCSADLDQIIATTRGDLDATVAARAKLEDRIDAEILELSEEDAEAIEQQIAEKSRFVQRLTAALRALDVRRDAALAREAEAERQVRIEVAAEAHAMALEKMAEYDRLAAQAAAALADLAHCNSVIKKLKADYGALVQMPEPLYAAQHHPPKTRMTRSGQVQVPTAQELRPLCQTVKLPIAGHPTAHHWPPPGGLDFARHQAPS